MSLLNLFWSLVDTHLFRVSTTINDNINATIITGVIYNKKPTYLSKSKIKIPIYYYKVLFIGNKRYYWLGDNKKDFYKKGDKIPISSLEELNKLFKSNKMDVKITLNIK